ncbi:MAG: transglycosylase SLT domain-containing protein, partial [Bacteroidales bacterium]|nr:transglycosylase SLT domain-containing protein [Bacteroidales bacterium]
MALLLMFLLSALLVAGQSRNDEMEKVTRENYDSLLNSYYVRKYTNMVGRYYSGKTDLAYKTFDEIPDSVFERRLRALPTVIPLTYNQEVRSYIKMYIRVIGRRLDVMLSLAEYYFPLFEEELNKVGAPLELKYLTIVESALNPRATSRAGASGLWQFMYRTGRNYGLSVNSLVDERRDPVKSTQAAARFLKDLYGIYGDWTLAMAAYNCGPGGVNKAMARAGGKHDFWQIYPYLPKETRGYIPAYIAAAYVMNYYYMHGLAPNRIEIPIHNDTIQMKNDALFCFISKYADIDIAELRDLNPQYRVDMVPISSGCNKLTLPVDKIPQVIRVEDSIYMATRDSLTVRPVKVSTAQNKVVYRVKRGDTLAKIASKYGVSQADIKRWSHKRSSTVKVGERLIIYRNGKEEPLTVNQTVTSQSETNDAMQQAKVAAKPASEKKSGTEVRYYTVRRGDNLSSIAKRNGTTP